MAILAQLHISLLSINRELPPGLACRVDEISARPPLHTPTTHDERPQYRPVAADLNGHRVFAVELGQFDSLGRATTSLKTQGRLRSWPNPPIAQQHLEIFAIGADNALWPLSSVLPTGTQESAVLEMEQPRQARPEHVPGPTRIAGRRQNRRRPKKREWELEIFASGTGDLAGPNASLFHKWQWSC